MLVYNHKYIPLNVSLPLKDDEINHQSQMVEKLKEQMLDQEEVNVLGFWMLSSVCLNSSQWAFSSWEPT